MNEIILIGSLIKIERVIYIKLQMYFYQGNTDFGLDFSNYAGHLGQ